MSKSACSNIYEIRKRNEPSIAQHQHHQNMSHTVLFTELHIGRIDGGNKGPIHDSQVCHGGFSRHSPFSSESKNESDLIQL